ncbi:HsdM family class I SAM-dependent methyltransferase [Desulfobacca acetoxidans]|uniref:site-specific DNA-methyltransferase (adenine-specific) n=1 Tax=Desulfobacca acetoxidans (strain ATCC 700848 / DSM 11109 / ASRB2) TaxID=880072 RepID=F2NH01_DESAR|nr:N-6 DNA methylase [Desulfobacca acetoxidans]AEB08772.1 N-6 DNA methylase [Desulfobacca acetoxidans DSM 11109]
MNTHVGEIFQRFLALFPSEADALLSIEQIQSADAIASTKTPYFTVLIKGRHSQGDEPLAMVLMTLPSLSAEDHAILDFASRRARAYKAPFFLTWTLRQAILWRTPKPGIPASRDSLEKVKQYPELFEVDATEQHQQSEPVKLTILNRGKELIRDLESLHKNEALELVQLDATYFVGRLLEAVHTLLPLVSASIHQRLQHEIQFNKEISAWAVKQAIAGSPSDPEFAQAIARQIIYRLLGKVLFYQSLRRSARHLPKLELDRVDTSQVLPTLRAAFTQALAIDYHAVFEEDVPDRLQWPSQASLELAKLIGDFNTRDFAHLPQDVVGNVFERLIPPEERHGLGQYFTSENLCDFIAAFCIRSPHDTVLDPSCGTGTFLIRAYDRLRWLGRHDHTKLLSQIWGVDIGPFPAELATINLFRQRISEHGNFPRIICQDFFRITPGECFPFPPPKMDLDNPQTIEEPFPQFEAIIGNFPYVSADRIEKYEAGYLDFIRRRLLNGWFEDYPQLFCHKNQNAQIKFERDIAENRHKRNDYQKNGLQIHISTYADLYVYLFFHAARFLKPGGRMGIVTSNAWLDVNYGFELQKFFLQYFKIAAILESRCEPWFTEAAVNTIVTILERCDVPQDRDAHLVRFVKVKRALNDLIPGDPVIEALPRWQHLTGLVHHLEKAGNKYGKTYPLGMVTEENDNFRIRILRQGEMSQEVERTGKTVKWGRYLRAPQVFFDLITKGKVCLFRDIAALQRGGLTRINEFFHITQETAAKFNLEDEYLLPLMKSPKETSTIFLNPNDLKLRIFVCRKNKKELEKEGHYGALRYIEWGEKQTYKTGEFKGLTWPEGTWLKKRYPGWWALPDNETQTGQIFWNKDRADRHFTIVSQLPIIPDSTCYFIKADRNIISDMILAAFLNSTICYLFIEIVGRVILGDGVLATKVEEANEYLHIPDPRLLSEDEKKEILSAFEKLSCRQIESIFDEVKQVDRNALDTLILKAMGLDPRQCLKPLYEGLCELVRERIQLGQMRQKARKTKTRVAKAEQKIAEEVLDEIIPEGPRRFPEDFFSPAAAADIKHAVELPPEPILFNNIPLFMEVQAKDGDFRHPVASPAEGKFLVYAQQAGHQVAQVPDKKVEISRTVANYERYLRELRQQLTEAYYRWTLDARAAARLTQSAFNRFHLPTPEE